MSAKLNTKFDYQISESLTHAVEEQKNLTTTSLELDIKTIQDIVLMHEDMAAALSALPDFGYHSTQNIQDIEKAEDTLNTMRNILQFYIQTGTEYQETFHQVMTLLKEMGVSQCVDDLITVRRNSRKSKNSNNLIHFS